MVDVEQALGRLPEDPAFAAEPLPAIEARAARRRRHRWQGRGAALVTAVVLALAGVAALTSPGPPQVVDTAAGGSRSQAGGSTPAVGASRPTVVAEGDVGGGGHWRLLASRTDKGLCLDVELGGRVSSRCEPATAVGPDRAITGAASTGLGQAFVSGLIRKDVAGVRVESDGTDWVDLAPAGADKGFDVNFYVTPLPPGALARKAVALDAAGAPVGEVGFAVDPPAGPDDTVTTPTTSSDTRPVDTRPADDQQGDDGSQSSPPLPAPTDPVVPTSVDPSLGLCTAGQVTTAVTTEKGSYALGEAVHGTATIRNNSGTPCLLPTRAFFQIEDSAGGLVSAFAYTADYRFPTRAEPGQSFASTVTWDQQSCSTPLCSPAPPGTYVAAAEWTEGARFSAQASFEIAA